MEPEPLAGGPTSPFVPNLAIAKAVENGLPDDTYYTYLSTGGTGLTAGTPDTRIPNVNSLPAGPFQITPGIPYDAYAASPVHRFYQMWQQLDCNVNYSDTWNPSGCKSDLLPWVETTVGAGSNGLAAAIHALTIVQAGSAELNSASTRCYSRPWRAMPVVTYVHRYTSATSATADPGTVTDPATVAYV